MGKRNMAAIDAFVDSEGARSGSLFTDGRHLYDGVIIIAERHGFGDSEAVYVTTERFDKQVTESTNALKEALEDVGFEILDVVEGDVNWAAPASPVTSSRALRYVRRNASEEPADDVPTD